MRYFVVLLIIIAAGAYYVHERDQEARQRTVDAEATEQQAMPLISQPRAVFVAMAGHAAHK